MPSKTYSPEEIAALVASIKAKKAAAQRVVIDLSEGKAELATAETVAPLGLKADASAFHWNERQLQAIELATTGKSFCLVGAAGTGKTTTTKEIVRRLIHDVCVPPISSSTKVLQAGGPGIVGTSFTRRAVRNLRNALSADLSQHCSTFHNLLEYEPVYFDIFDPATGETRTTMRFEPCRTSRNPLPSSLSVILVDEGSMVSVELYDQLFAALPYPDQVQFIFLGDLNQLPPVYGRAILGFKLNELPVVELNVVYRQALESPIIRLAHRILSGNPITNDEAMSDEWKADPRLVLHPWKKQLETDVALGAACAFMRKEIDEGRFNEEDSVVLCPYNVSFGVIELNKAIAQKLGVMRNATVYEVIAGFNKYYLAPGDRVLVDKEDGIVEKIVRNGRYLGKRPQIESPKLDRWGALQLTKEELEVIQAQRTAEEAKTALEQLDALTDFLESDDINERKQQASHIVKIRMLDNDRLVELDTAAELNDLIFSYALTVHKSQGSEWRKVYCLLHHSHAAMVSRELLYTMVTRAREELYIIFEPARMSGRSPGGSLFTGVKTARLKGTTWQEKAEFFKGISEKELFQLSNGKGN